MIVIVSSSVALAAEDPVSENSIRNCLLEYFDHAFTCVFAIEMLLKVSFSTFLNEILYLISKTTRAVLKIVFFIFSFILPSKNLSTIKSLRVLRVLRPLKTIRRVPKLKVSL
ncbi:unnamed protein product [Trichobilharzia regenti]|nr:unnamed protein product [Trichobilharzia regenti]